MTCKIGTLKIIRSTLSGKRFVGCSEYFNDQNCNTTYPLPQGGMLETTKELCKADEYPQVKVYPGGRRPWTLCLNPTCSLREEFEKRKKKLKGWINLDCVIDNCVKEIVEKDLTKYCKKHEIASINLINEFEYWLIAYGSDYTMKNYLERIVSDDDINKGMFVIEVAKYRIEQQDWNWYHNFNYNNVYWINYGIGFIR